jgi:hypothetical protein
MTPDIESELSSPRWRESCVVFFAVRQEMRATKKLLETTAEIEMRGLSTKLGE